MDAHDLRPAAPLAALDIVRPVSAAPPDLDALGERIAALSAQLQAATYFLLVLIRDFDERGAWNGGFRSCAHWLNWRTGLELGAAREKVRVARALATLPLLSAAMARGEVSFSKVRALTRVATPRNEGELLELAKAGTAAHVPAHRLRCRPCGDAARADGTVLDVGRRTRAMSTPLRRALARRDGGCRFPGCGLKLCDAHHVEHWADGGKTKLGNLVQLCRRHHRAVPEEGFRVELLPSGEAHFFRPDGRRLADAPTPPPLTADPLASLAAELDRHGVAVDPRSGLPTWDGTPLDLALAVDCYRSVGVERRHLPA